MGSVWFGSALFLLAINEHRDGGKHCEMREFRL
jgi:hypothetical protein